MEDKSQFNATGGDSTELAKIASAFSEKIEAAGYDVGIYANRNWFTNYLTDPVFDNWVRWVAEYGVSQCQYGGEYGMWQLFERRPRERHRAIPPMTRADAST